MQEGQQQQQQQQKQQQQRQARPSRAPRRQCTCAETGRPACPYRLGGGGARKAPAHTEKQYISIHTHMCTRQPTATTPPPPRPRGPRASRASRGVWGRRRVGDEDVCVFDVEEGELRGGRSGSGAVRRGGRSCQRGRSPPRARGSRAGCSFGRSGWAGARVSAVAERDGADVPRS